MGNLTKSLTRELHSATYPLRKHRFRHKRILACVFSTGEPTEDACLQSVSNQSHPVSRIEVIKNVTPMSKAFNTQFDRADDDTDYILHVDADMILLKSCLRHLLSLMRPNVLYTVAGLKDPIFGTIGHIRLMNLRLKQELGIAFRDIPHCDIDLVRQARAKRPNLIPTYGSIYRVQGYHLPVYNAKRVFQRIQIRQRDGNKRIDKKLMLSLCKSYIKTGNKVLLYGILGLIIPNPDYSRGESSPCPNSGLTHWETVARLMDLESSGAEYSVPSGAASNPRRAYGMDTFLQYVSTARQNNFTKEHKQ